MALITNDNDLPNKTVWDLIKIRKWTEKGETINLSEGCHLNYELQSIDRNNKFNLDINREKIELKYSLQTRMNTDISLIRLDYKGYHTNPNSNCEIDIDDPFYKIHDKCMGKMFINEPHVHIYRKGFGNRWAYPVDTLFNETNDIKVTLHDFTKLCNISGYILQGNLDEYQ